MSTTPFEYEERYKAIDPAATRRALEAAAFELTGTERQIDHWFLPKGIMTPHEQAHWFDHEGGYALRIRETATPQGTSTLITAKQLLRPGDHSAMTNLEKPLTAAGAALVLSAIGDEFADVIAQLQSRAEEQLPFAEAKKLIESAGRKEYITLEKQRSSFQNPGAPNIVIDLDVVPALQHTTLEPIPNL